MQAFAPQSFLVVVESFAQKLIDVVGNFRSLGAAGVAVGGDDGFGQFVDEGVLVLSEEASAGLAFRGGNYMRRGWRGQSATRRQVRVYSARPSGCGNASRKPSGATNSAFMRSRSTGKSSRAGCVPRTPDNCCSRASCVRIVPISSPPN